MAGKAKFIAAGLLIVAAVAYLIVSSTGSTAHYFLTIEELQAMGNEASDRNITVSGAVLGDTISYDASAPRGLRSAAQSSYRALWLDRRRETVQATLVSRLRGMLDD